MSEDLGLLERAKANLKAYRKRQKQERREKKLPKKEREEAGKKATARFIHRNL